MPRPCLHHRRHPGRPSRPQTRASPRHAPRRRRRVCLRTARRTHQSDHLPAQPQHHRRVTSWQPYLLIAAGIAALVISQSAYQAGPLAYHALIAVLEPLLSVLIGATAFGEEIRLTGGYLIAKP